MEVRKQTCLPPKTVLGEKWMRVCVCVPLCKIMQSNPWRNFVQLNQNEKTFKNELKMLVAHIRIITTILYLWKFSNRTLKWLCSLFHWRLAVALSWLLKISNCAPQCIRKTIGLYEFFCYTRMVSLLLFVCLVSYFFASNIIIHSYPSSIQYLKRVKNAFTKI